MAPPPSQAIPAPPSPPRLTLLVGRASWYGGAHHGRLTASGECFDINALTAAHRTLPFGTRLRVVNLNNNRAVEVRVNDRGPVVPGRMLDLSYKAARARDAAGDGYHGGDQFARRSDHLDDGRRRRQPPPFVPAALR